MWGLTFVWDRLSIATKRSSKRSGYRSKTIPESCSEVAFHQQQMHRQEKTRFQVIRHSKTRPIFAHTPPQPTRITNLHLAVATDISNWQSVLHRSQPPFRFHHVQLSCASASLVTQWYPKFKWQFVVLWFFIVLFQKYTTVWAWIFVPCLTRWKNADKDSDKYSGSVWQIFWQDFFFTCRTQKLQSYPNLRMLEKKCVWISWFAQGLWVK